MKLLLTTQADDNIKDITDITHPIFKQFAKKWKADFFVINTPSLCYETVGYYNETDHYRILNIYDLYEDYDRILYLDSDMIINEHCPNIFDIVPYDTIGVAHEDKGSRESNRLERIKLIQDQFGDINWKEGYPNNGTLITSKAHRDIFSSINGNWWLGPGYDCLLLGYQINRLQYPIQELSFKWNHMTMFSESWHNHASRFESYIIHYAGQGVFDSNVLNRTEQIKKDYIYNKIKQANISFKSEQGE